MVYWKLCFCAMVWGKASLNNRKVANGSITVVDRNKKVMSLSYLEMVGET